MDHLASPNDAATTPAYRRWTPERVARLGFLVGAGCTAEAAACHPDVATTPGNVRRQANRFGLALRETSDRRLPPEVGERLDAAAAKRNLSRDRLVRRLLAAAVSEPGLIDNILDDADVHG